MRAINARAESFTQSGLSVREAVNFVTGAEADFVRATDLRGGILATWRIDSNEPRAIALARIRSEAEKLGAARMVIGGVPQLEDEVPTVQRQASRNAIVLPDGKFHGGQVEALRVIQANRFTAVRAGRRFGKSSLAAALAADVALCGNVAGLFAPTYKLASPLFDMLVMTLGPLISSSNRSFGELRLAGGGGVDVWTLEHPRAGRGRRYGLVVIDEAAFGGPDLTTIWDASIRPTLADTMGPAIACSTPAGVAEDNFFWRICHEESYGFAQFAAPTSRNPFIPIAEIEALRVQHNPLVFAQEFLAEFVNLAGVGLFDVSRMLDAGSPWKTTGKLDLVFATLDSGVKGGQAHDASAVVYCGFNKYIAPQGLFVLDWEAVELGAGDLELWFAGVGRKLAGFAEEYARLGPSLVFIENAGLGEMLLAKGSVLGVPTQEIDSKLVARGKDLRALAAERFINGGQVRLTQAACDRISRLKGVARNHLLAQTAGFRVADKDAWKRSDDLVDALVYATLVAFNVE
jgi:hypothetical protein